MHAAVPIDHIFRGKKFSTGCWRCASCFDPTPRHGLFRLTALVKGIRTRAWFGCPRRFQLAAGSPRDPDIRALMITANNSKMAPRIPSSLK
jgi:hypothetical protein